MNRPFGEVDIERRMYIVNGWDTKFLVKNNKIYYGEGLFNADSWDFYNSDLAIYNE